MKKEDFLIIETVTPPEEAIIKAAKASLRKPRKKIDPQAKKRRLRKNLGNQLSHERKLRQEWLAAGLCTKCGKAPAREGGRRCDGCREKFAARRKKQRDEAYTKEGYLDSNTRNHTSKN